MTENHADILIVEDDIYSVEFMLDALEQHHPADSIKVFHDGTAVLNYLFPDRMSPGRNSCGHPKLIFLDLKLPRMNGFEVLRQIRTRETTRTIPVVVFTSSTDEGDRMESYRLGTNSYVVKPVAYESFIKAVAEIGFYWTSLNIPS